MINKRASLGLLACLFLCMWLSALKPGTGAVEIGLLLAMPTIMVILTVLSASSAALAW